MPFCDCILDGCTSLESQQPLPSTIVLRKQYTFSRISWHPCLISTVANLFDNVLTAYWKYPWKYFFVSWRVVSSNLTINHKQPFTEKLFCHFSFLIRGKETCPSSQLDIAHDSNHIWVNSVNFRTNGSRRLCHYLLRTTDENHLKVSFLSTP